MPKDLMFQLFNKLTRGVQAANAALVDVGLNLSGQEIDEVALLFMNEREAWKFIERAVQLPGVKLFNVASDNVRTNPIRSQYGVQYYFLETTWGYRVECMVLSGGHSPLHGGISATYFDVVGNRLDSGIVHYSWKCNDEAEYAEACKTMESVGGWKQAMSCLSTYGMFSYWLTDEDTDQRLLDDRIEWCLAEKEKALEAYIKPRVNLRDADGNVPMEALDYLESKA